MCKIFRGSCGRNRARIFKRNLRNEIAHRDNAVLSPSRNRYGTVRRDVANGTYGVTCICAIAVDKSVEKSSRKSRRARARVCICRQYPARVFHIKISLNPEEHDGTCESKIQPRFHASVLQLFPRTFPRILQNNCCEQLSVNNW